MYRVPSFIPGKKNFRFSCLLPSDDRKTCVLRLQLHLYDRPAVVVGFLGSRGHDRCAAAGIVGSSVGPSISATLFSSCLDVVGASKY